MLSSRLFPAALAVVATVLMAGCSTTSPTFNRTATSSIAPHTMEQSAKERYSGMATNGRNGYVTRRVQS